MTIKFGGGNSTQTKIGQIRRTQLVTTFGPGALVDMPDYSVIMGAIDDWKTPRAIREQRLEALLGVRCFKEPKESDDAHISPGVIPAHRFPYIHYCRKCGRLGEYWKIGKDKSKKRCNECGGELVPSRFVAACENGHIEDFPYNWWVHRGRFEKSHKLRIKYSTNTGELDGIVIVCETCGKERSMKNCISHDALSNLRCGGRRPWVGRLPEDNDQEPCHAHVRALQRGASNIYFPITVSALTIPEAFCSTINEHWNEIQTIWQNPNLDMSAKRLFVEAAYGKNIRDEGWTLDDAISQIESGRDPNAVSYTKQSLYEGEYRALCGSDKDEPNFRTRHIGVPNGLEDYLDDVVQVNRLREILVLTGFRRIKPEPDFLTDVSDEEGSYMPLSRVKTDWLPAMELLGEGVFIKLNEKTLRAWEEKAGNRYEKMGLRLSRSSVRCGNFSPRYVLLHTLAHLLIRQLTIDCGYSGSSIKERIYSSYSGEGLDMEGILLYTSSSDSDGSLGGLVRQALPGALKRTIEGALESASWCSSDPVCCQSMAQGYDALNYAACHACALLPETSCEMRNCFLDRAALVGTLNDSDLGYFHSFFSSHDGQR